MDRAYTTSFDRDQIADLHTFIDRCISENRTAKVEPTEKEIIVRVGRRPA